MGTRTQIWTATRGGVSAEVERVALGGEIWWDWGVWRDGGDPIAQGVSWVSAEEARRCAEAILEIMSLRVAQ